VVRRVLAVLALTLLVAAAFWNGQRPPRSLEAYRVRAEETAVALLSQARTADLLAAAVATGRVTHGAAVVTVEEVAVDAERTSARFSDWDPPAQADGLQQDLSRLAEQVGASLTADRVAAHRGSWSALTGSAAQRQPLESQLTELIAQLQKGAS
jgi:hypothetical protein